MTTQIFDPHHLDLRCFAETASTLAGDWPAAGFERLAADAPPAGTGTVCWSAQGEQRDVKGATAQTWLHLQAETTVTLICQRCLKPMVHAVHGDRSFHFVADEAEAERLDEESEDDVLAMPPRGRLDLRPLIEDELILALPIVPRHDVCPEPLPMPAEDPAAAPPPHPFEALAALKRKPN